MRLHRRHCAHNERGYFVAYRLYKHLAPNGAKALCLNGRTIGPLVDVFAPLGATCL